MFDMMALGGYRTNVNVKSTTLTGIANQDADFDYNYVFGMRGRTRLSGASRIGWSPPSTTMAVDSNGNKLYKFALYPNYASPAKVIDKNAVIYSDDLSSDSVTNYMITCSDTNWPVEGCSSGNKLSVQGLLRMDSGDLTSAGITKDAIVLDLFNPLYYTVLSSSVIDATSTNGDTFAIYWTMFKTIIDRVPP